MKITLKNLKDIIREVLVTSGYDRIMKNKFPSPYDADEIEYLEDVWPNQAYDFQQIEFSVLPSNVASGFEALKERFTQNAKCDECGGSGKSDEDECESCEGFGNYPLEINYYKHSLQKDGKLVYGIETRDPTAPVNPAGEIFFYTEDGELVGNLEN
jgi:hypothetical protein